MATLSTDNFNRVSPNSLGTTPSGDLWTATPAVQRTTIVDNAARFFSDAASRNIIGWLNLEPTINSDVTVTMWLDHLTDIGNFVGRVIPRTVSGSDDYNVRVTITPAGGMSIGMYRSEASGFGGSITLPGTYAPGEKLKIRAQAIGINPTTLRAKIWRETESEPSAWMLSATDTTETHQMAGRVALRGGLAGSVTAFPFYTFWDDLVVTDGGATPIDPDPEEPEEPGEPTGVTFMLRRGTTAQWNAADPVLHAGEPGVDLTTGVLKIGDGTKKWSLLTAISGGPGGGSADAIEGVGVTQIVRTTKANLPIPSARPAGTIYVVSG